MADKNPVHERTLVAVLRRRIQEPEPLIQVVVGPRQVGKTTAIRQALAGRGVYASADSPTPMRPEDIAAWWGEARAAAVPLLAIDEVQKISGWAEAVKQLWDTQTSPRVTLIVSGSAALAIERDLRESLAGRFELLRVAHWTLQEARQVFGMDLQAYTERGCYPGAMRFAADVSRWAEYIRDAIVEPAIGRDIMQLHPVQNPALLRQLFAAAVSLPAQVVSLHGLQGALQDRGALATLQHYLELLGHAYLVTGVQKYSAAALRVRRSPPKICVHDNGLLRAFERPVTAPPDASRLGHYFENCVMARFIEAGWEVHYWRERDLEVDLVVLGPQGERWALEVKSGRTAAQDLRGLQMFVRRHPGFEPYLVSAVDQRLPGFHTLAVASVLGLHRGGDSPTPVD